MPIFVGASKDEETLMKKIPRAAHLYISTAIIDIQDNLPHYEKWFGKYDENRFNDVRKVLPIYKK